MTISGIFQQNHSAYRRIRKLKLRTLISFLLALFSTIISTQCLGEDRTRTFVVLPNVESTIPRAYSKFKTEIINESSGIVKSRIHDNVFWTHNDSGDSARLFAVDRNGSPINPLNTNPYKGIAVSDAFNVDWEDITTDNSGNIYIGDVGNNMGEKELFSIYKISEPSPVDVLPVQLEQTIKIYYPDKENPSLRQSQINAEALFWAKNYLFIITKCVKSRFSELYSLRLDNLEHENPVTLIASFDFKGMVTGADASPNGRQLAVLTYNGIWLFTQAEDSLNYFHGAISWFPIRAGQCEAICFDSDRLIITNEQGRLFEFAISKLIPIANPYNPE